MDYRKKVVSSDHQLCMEDRHTLDADVILRRVRDGIEEGGFGHSYMYLVVRMRADGCHGNEGSQGTNLMSFQFHFRDMRDWG